MSPYDYLADKTLNREFCEHIAGLFNSSQLRRMMKASRAEEVQFRSEDGIRSCHYWYDFPMRGGRSRLEYKVYQRDGRRAYAITAIYDENSPDRVLLQEALHTFTIKTGKSVPQELQ